jgi:hypothetical protein
MAIDGSQPGCFVHGAKIYAVPSDSVFTVEETRSSFVRASSVRLGRRSRLHWSAFVAAAVGGVFLVASAWHASGFPDFLSLCLVFVLGALVGFATAVGMREVLLSHGQEVTVVRLPAIEIPGDVARSAPDDATVDELVLWSVLTRRYRAAKVAVETLPDAGSAEAAELGEAADSATRSTGTITPASTSALAELTFVTARHDYEPVAALLGLPLDD